MIDRDIARLEENFAGISLMEKLPDALLVVDTRRESIAVDEARTLSIPVIGIMNSDCDATQATFPVIGNDASRESVKFFLDSMLDAYRSGREGKN
jgi:small subunit ribosomal protein S2